MLPGMGASLVGRDRTIHPPCRRHGVAPTANDVSVGLHCIIASGDESVDLRDCPSQSSADFRCC